jgi:hypothetical protein
MKILSEMSQETFTEPATPQELAYELKIRSVRWVRQQCKLKKIKTLPIGAPYLIPAYEANRILGVENDGN